MKEGWVYKKLGEIATIRRGLTYKKEDEVEKSNKIVLRSNNVDLETHQLIFDELKYLKDDFDIPEEKILKKGDLLMCMSNGSKIHLGKVALIEQNTHFAFGGFMSAIEHNKSVLDKFFYYALISPNFKQHIKELQDGANINNLKIRDIESFSIPIPSFPDQQRIVSYLDAEFAKIEALKANAEKQLQAAKDLFQAALKELLTPKEGWEEKKLGEIGNICGRIGFRGYTTKDMVSGPNEGAITLSPSNIQDGAMDYTKCQYISWYKYNESPEIMVQNGDVLIVKTGSSYGKSAIVDKLPHKATINPQSVVIKNIRINNRLFAYLIRTPWVQNDFDNFVAGTAIPTFSQANLSKVLLAFPKETDEQQRIADRLDALSANVKALQTNYTETITLCNDLKQALLKKVFG